MTDTTKQTTPKRSTWARLRGMWTLADGYHRLYILATLSLGMAALAKTVSYLLLARFIDGLMTASEIMQIVLLFALAFIGLAFIEGTFTFLSGRMAARTAEGITRRLRNEMFDHMQRLTFAFHDRAQTGDLI
ncbi:MAG: hypothetical protein JNL34_13670, partial [Anaerolineae bacterium]|nr:hypothetical protein [Anaerolineae bacterium]